jgi:hypothetical protein
MASELEVGKVNVTAKDTSALLSLYRDDATIGNNNVLGDINFGGADAPNESGAIIRGITEAAWTSGSAPTGISFMTTPTSSVSASERLRISSTGTAKFTGEIHSDSTAPKISMTDNNSFADPNDKFIIRGGGGGTYGAGYLQWFDDSANTTTDIARFDGETQLATFYGGIKSEKGIYGGQITIADDAVGTISPPRQGVMMAISYGNNSAYPAHQNNVGLIWCDTGATLSCAKMTSEGSNISVFNGVDLSAAGETSSVDNNTNISTISSTIQIKNRLGSTVEFWYNFIA